MPAWLAASITTRDLPVRRKESWSSAVLQKLLPDPVPSMAPSLTDQRESHIQPIRVLPSKISFDPGRTSGGESSALPGPRPPVETGPASPPPAGGPESAAPPSLSTGEPPAPPVPSPPTPPPLAPPVPAPPVPLRPPVGTVEPP